MNKKKKTGNGKSLVIVESPTKAKTINKYLGSRYTVKSSMGHLIDLPKSRLAVDVEHDFEPDYITIRGRGKLLNELKQAARKTENVYLAADSDREGEAISYHIGNALKKANPDANIRRITFNEITENAIKEAMRNPRGIDDSLVNAQKARRVLDRLVGYNLSPLLWEKIKKGLSAGRVQTVALRVICEREREIEAFVPEEYWTVEGRFRKGKAEFDAKLISFEGRKVALKSETEAQAVLDSMQGRQAVVAEIESKKRRRKPPAPFTTSKMQQAAGSRLGWQARKTMMIAQQLYEGINLESGPVGLITYMRTDSVRISGEAAAEAERYIEEKYSKEYLPGKARSHRNKGGSQDAHEAIRPTSVYRTPAGLKQNLSRDQFKLYSLIWEQFLASQMADAVYQQERIDVQVGEGIFRATGQKLLFNGFTAVLKSGDKDTALPRLEKGDELETRKIEKEVHYTEPPPRFTDATLVKFLEDSGIGRPSTYAPIISTLLSRYYIVREKRQFKPTFLGNLTNDLLVKHFPDLFDINFTSRMESRLDEIADGKLEWVQLLREFYSPFIELVSSAQQRLESYKGITDEETEHVCSRCGKQMIKKLGKYGFFLACSGFPECRNTMPLPLGNCPREGCDGFVIERKTKRRRTFYGCSNYPDCDFMIWDRPIACPACGSVMVEKKNEEGDKILACLNEQCGNTEPVDRGSPELVESGHEKRG